MFAHIYSMYHCVKLILGGDHKVTQAQVDVVKRELTVDSVLVGCAE